MVRALLGAVAAAMISAPSAFAADPFAGLEVLPAPVAGPTLALVNEAGDDVPLSGAPVTVLNFWATWCAPCVAELPTLIELDESLSERGLRVVGASLDRNYGAINSFWSKQGFGDALEIALDDKGSLFREFSSDELGARGLPYTAILNAEGEIVSWFAGDTEWASEEVVAYFGGLLDEAEAESN